MENIKFIDITQLPEDLWQDAKNLIALDSNGDVIKAEKQDSYSKDEIDGLLKGVEISADKLQNKIQINSASTDYVVTQPTVSGDSLVITDAISDKNQYHTFGYDKSFTVINNGLLNANTPLYRGTNEYNCPKWDGNSIKFQYYDGYNVGVRLTIPYTYNGVKYVTHIDTTISSSYKIDMKFGEINDQNFVGYQSVPFKQSEIYNAFGANGTFIFKLNDVAKDYYNLESTYSNFIFPGNTIEMTIANFQLTASNGALIIETPRFYILSNNFIYGDVPTERYTSDYPERLSDYIRYSNDVKAYILTDKNTTFKTINGQQITGNGDIEISTDVDLSGYATKTELNAKQDVISDLDTIRSGAAKGATALQSVPSEYTTEQWVNSQGFLKEHQDISNLATKAELNAKQDVITDLDSIRSGAALGATALQSVPSEYATEQWVNGQGFLKEHQDISNLATKTELATKQDTLVSGTNIKTINGNSLLGSGNIEVAANVDLSDYYTKSQTNALVSPKLSQVTLTQAEYDALSTKEENVLYVISDAANVDPSNLATKEELNTKQDVINDLETIRSGAAKGATALQSVPDTYALKSEIPDITTKQDKLVSGTNIKTINGNSLLGSGNIEIKASADNVPTVQTTPKGKTSNYIYSTGTLDNYGVISDIANFITYSTDKASIKTWKNYWGEESANVHQNWSINGATTSEAGLMSASDKTKLDGIDLSTKQDTLVSGTNIKSINGTSLLGSGDITIEGGADLSGYYTKSEIDSMIGGVSSTITEINNLVV